MDTHYNVLCIHEYTYNTRIIIITVIVCAAIVPKTFSRLIRSFTSVIKMAPNDDGYCTYAKNEIVRIFRERIAATWRRVQVTFRLGNREYNFTATVPFRKKKFETVRPTVYATNNRIRFQLSRLFAVHGCSRPGDDDRPFNKTKWITSRAPNVEREQRRRIRLFCSSPAKQNTPKRQSLCRQPVGRYVRYYKRKVAGKKLGRGRCRLDVTE